MNSKFKISNSKPSFTLMELMLTIALSALIITIAVPTFIGINRGATAKAANNMVFASLKQAQQEASIVRQRAGFYIVTQVLAANPWVDSNMANRTFFIYAGNTPNVAKKASFVTSFQTLPAPMMFDFTAGGSPASSDSIPTFDIVDPESGLTIVRCRGFRFAPAGGLFMDDLQTSQPSGYRFHVVICEGLAAAGGAYTLKTTGPIRYTNTVNSFTGRVTGS